MSLPPLFRSGRPLRIVALTLSGLIVYLPIMECRILPLGAFLSALLLHSVYCWRFGCAWLVCLGSRLMPLILFSMKFASVILDIPTAALEAPYTYAVPETAEEQAQVTAKKPSAKMPALNPQRANRQAMPASLDDLLAVDSAQASWQRAS